MKAMQILKPAPIEEKPLKLVELPKPIPTNKQVLIKVSACGVCRTDLHVTEGDIKKGNYPIVPGHQIVGSIEELGNNCTRFKEGDRVGVAWLGIMSNLSFLQKKPRKPVFSIGIYRLPITRRVCRIYRSS